MTEHKRSVRAYSNISVGISTITRGRVQASLPRHTDRDCEYHTYKGLVQLQTDRTPSRFFAHLWVQLELVKVGGVRLTRDARHNDGWL